MVNIVELKIDWKKANSLDLKGRAEYFDNLAEQIAKASEQEEDKKRVLAGNQVCYISAKYEELFLTCYNEFDVSRTLEKKVEGKSLEEQADYFNTLAKKISKIEKVNPVSVPYGNKTCKIEARYAGLFQAAYREFAKCQREIKRQVKPTVTIDFKLANSLNNEKRADYFADLLKEIVKVPLKDDAELITINRLSQKVNKNDKEVFITCFNEFVKAKEAYEKEYEEELKKEREALKAEKAKKEAARKKTSKEIMDMNLEILTKIVSKPKKGHCVKKFIGSASYIINIGDEQAFNDAKRNYLEAKMKYTQEIREMARQHEYEIDKKLIDKLSDEQRKEYLEDLLKRIIERQIFMDTVDVHHGKLTYKINAVDKKTFKYCESTISGIKHMLAVQRKASKDIVLYNDEWSNPNNLEVIDADDEGLEENSKDAAEKQGLWQRFKKVIDLKKPKKEKAPKEKKAPKIRKEKTPKAAMSVDLIDRLYQYRINRYTSLPIKHGTRILVGDMEYRVDHKYKERLYKIMLSYDKYKKKKAELEEQSTAQKAFRGLVTAGAILLAAVIGRYAKGNLEMMISQNANNNAKASLESQIDDDNEYAHTNGAYYTFATASMAKNDGATFDTLVRDIVDPNYADILISEDFSQGSELYDDNDPMGDELEGNTGALTSGAEIAASGVVTSTIDEQTTVSGSDASVSSSNASVSSGDAETQGAQGSETLDTQATQSADASQIENDGQQSIEEDKGLTNDAINRNDFVTDDGKRKPEHEGELDPDGKGEKETEGLQEETEGLQEETEGLEEEVGLGTEGDKQGSEVAEAAKDMANGFDASVGLASDVGATLASQSVKEASNQVAQVYTELQYVETYEAISERVAEIGELPEETIFNEDLNAEKGNEEICYGYHLTTGNTIYDMPMWEALEVMYVGNEEDANTYQSALAVFSCIANRMEDGRFTYASDFHSIISAGNGGQFSVWNQEKASNYQLDQVPDYVLQAFYDCFYGGIRNVDTIEFRSSGNKADGRFQVVAGDNNHFKLAQHVDRADNRLVELSLTYNYSEEEQ